jgi:hypothetical protein
MATKKTGKKATTPTARKAPARRKAPALSGPPVTLAEAQALAQTAAPQRTVRRTAKAAAAQASLATIGQERAKLRAQRQAERDQRKKEYTDTLKIMKARGARRPAAAPTAGRRRAPGAGTSFQPLQVIAEGDSWFDYPYPLFGGGIIPRLQKRLGVPILNMADAGDEVRFMLGVDQRNRLVQNLKAGCPAGGPWDVLLFSGGGNDIVDNPMALWILDYNAALPPAKQIHQARFDAALALVRAGYEDLITLRDQLSPTTHLVFHGYDFAIPDGRGACHLGPWLKPTFDLRGFPKPTPGSASAVMKAMLQQFAAMLQGFTTRPKVTMVATQGTLAASPSSWHNELHPGKPGFNTFADKFQAHLKSLFPTRVV